MSDAEEGGEEKKGKSKVIVIIMILGILLGGGGLGAYVMMAKSSHANEHADGHSPEEIKEAEIKVEKTKVIKLKPMVVNIKGTRGTRYLKVTIGLETVSENVKTEIEEEIDVQLKDYLITRLMDVEIKDIDNFVGINKLKRDLAEGINLLLSEGVISKVYFTEFVIQ